MHTITGLSQWMASRRFVFFIFFSKYHSLTQTHPPTASPPPAKRVASEDSIVSSTLGWKICLFKWWSNYQHLVNTSCLALLVFLAKNQPSLLYAILCTHSSSVYDYSLSTSLYLIVCCFVVLFLYSAEYATTIIVLNSSFPLLNPWLLLHSIHFAYSAFTLSLCTITLSTLLNTIFCLNLPYSSSTLHC